MPADDTERNIRWTMQQYDFTYEEAAAIENERDGGTCEICGRPKGKRRHARDHHHGSGKFRGVLCLRCNLVLGLIEDRPEIAQSMIDYLGKPSPLPAESLIFKKGVDY